MGIRELTRADLDDIATWRYDGPWHVYDADGVLDPDLGYWAVVDRAVVDRAVVNRTVVDRTVVDRTVVAEGRAAGQLVGFVCLGVDARVPGLAEVPGTLDVGVGMRPDLVGRGRGREFATVALDFAASRGPRRLRAVVQDWNSRSLRLLDGLGFTRTGSHQVGPLTYVVVERDLG